MKRYYISRDCTVLPGQGMLEIMCEIGTGTLYICCDECLAQWENIDEALSGINGGRFKFGESRSATSDEIESAGWGKYVVCSEEYTANAVITFRPARSVNQTA